METPSENAFQTTPNIRFGNRKASEEAYHFRNYMKYYLNGIGSVVCSWQLDYIALTSSNKIWHRS